MLVSQTNNGNTDYFLQDAQNSTIGIADSSGAVTSSYAYDAFGNLDSSISGVSVETNYLYTGQQFDPVYTELYNLRARQYDPSIGRFSSRDKWAYNLGNPIELNRYGYSQNNPVNYVDPSGYNLTENGFMNFWRGTVTPAIQSFSKEFGKDFLIGMLAGAAGWSAGQWIAELVRSGWENFRLQGNLGTLGGGCELPFGATVNCDLVTFAGGSLQLLSASLLGGIIEVNNSIFKGHMDIHPTTSTGLKWNVPFQRFLSTFLLSLPNAVIIPAIDSIFSVIQITESNRTQRANSFSIELMQDAVVQAIGALFAGIAAALTYALSEVFIPKLNTYIENSINVPGAGTFIGFFSSAFINGLVSIPTGMVDDLTPFDPRLS